MQAWGEHDPRPVTRGLVCSGRCFCPAPGAGCPVALIVQNSVACRAHSTTPRRRQSHLGNRTKQPTNPARTHGSAAGHKLHERITSFEQAWQVPRVHAGTVNAWPELIAAGRWRSGQLGTCQAGAKLARHSHTDDVSFTATDTRDGSRPPSCRHFARATETLNHATVAAPILWNHTLPQPPHHTPATARGQDSREGNAHGGSPSSTDPQLPLDDLHNASWGQGLSF